MDASLLHRRTAEAFRIDADAFGTRSVSKLRKHSGAGSSLLKCPAPGVSRRMGCESTHRMSVVQGMPHIPNVVAERQQHNAASVNSGFGCSLLQPYLSVREGPVDKVDCR